MERFPSSIPPPESVAEKDSLVEEVGSGEISERDRAAIDSIKGVCLDVTRLFARQEDAMKREEPNSVIGGLWSMAAYLEWKIVLGKRLSRLMEENEGSLRAGLRDPEKREEIFGFFCLLLDLDLEAWSELGVEDKVREFVSQYIKDLEGFVGHDKSLGPNFFKVSREILNSSGHSGQMPVSEDSDRLRSILQFGVRNLAEESNGLEISDEKSAQLVGKYKDLILMCLEDQLEGEHIEDQIVAFFMSDQLDEENAILLGGWISEHSKSFDDFESQGFYVANTILSHFGFSQDQIKEMTKIWLSQKKINPIKSGGRKREADVPAIGLELLSIKRLEKGAPGITKYLRENFGIRCFSRYGDTILLEQYKNRESELSDVGIFVNALTEMPWWTIVRVMPEFVQELSTIKVGTVVVEAGDKIELLKILSRLSRRVSGNRFSFLFVNAHGHSPGDAISLSEDSDLSTEDFSEMPESVRQRVLKFLKPDGEIFFSSCLIGADGGLAEKINLELGIPITSFPLFVADITSFGAEKMPSGGVRFRGVTYVGSEREKGEHAPSLGIYRPGRQPGKEGASG